MANCLECFGLEMFKENEENALALFKMVAKEGKVINGYYDYPYINYSAGNVDLILNTIKSENGLEAITLETQSSGCCIWDVKIKSDITPKDSYVVEKRLLVSDKSDNHLAVIDVVNSDVLPSFLTGDIVKLQMVAFAQFIDYFEDEEAYIADWPGDYSLSDGLIMPGEFLRNHNPKIEENKKDYSSDSVVLIRGTVKYFRDGMLEVDSKKEKGYMRCFIDTNFGELELIHTYEQIKKEQYKNLRAGSVVSGAFILSGDAAIYEYEKGIIRDEEHHLCLLRYTFEEGHQDRLSIVLNENAVYYSEVTQKEVYGKDNVINHMRYVQENTSHIYSAYMAKITNTDENLKFKSGKRCVVLASDKKDKFESIVFIEQDSDNNIKEIYLSNDTRYQFELDKNINSSLNDKMEAPTLTSVADIKSHLDECRLVGRKIVSMKTVGYSYNLSRDKIEDYVYMNTSDFPEDMRSLKSEYANIEPEFEFGCESEIDEPFLIRFDDDEVFAIDTPMQTEFCFSINCINWNATANINQSNVDTNILFEVCLNKKITETEVETYTLDKHPLHHTPFDENNSKKEFVKRIILWLENGIGICIEGWLDFCEVYCVDREKYTITIPFRRLKSALRNYEDLHYDEMIGFAPKSTWVYSLPKGIDGKYIETPYITFTPKSKKSSLSISFDDFGPLSLSISTVLNTSFDEYEDYEVTYKQWQEILREANYLIGLEWSVDLTDYVKKSCPDKLYYIKNNGVNFYRYREKYSEMINDIMQWTDLAVENGEGVNIIGF